MFRPFLLGGTHPMPFKVKINVLLLLAILDDELGPYKPPVEPTLEAMEPAPPPTLSAFDV